MIEQELAYAGALHGNCNYTRTEYDHLTGYQTDSYSLEWTDQQGTRWRKTCTVINLGRPDRGIPVDPDKELGQEPQLFDEHHAMHATEMANRAAKVRRDALLVEQMREFLLEHGPYTATKMAKKMGISHNRALDVMRVNPKVFCLIGRHDRAWGLVGVEYDAQTRSVVSENTIKARQFLVDHGPATAPEIARHLGMKGKGYSNTLKLHRELFHVVAMRPAMGMVQATPLWGVVGVHEAQR